MYKVVRVYQGNKTVTTAGTQVALTSSQIVTPKVVIQAKPGNTGNIFVGTADVSSSDYGVVLAPGASTTLVASHIETGESGLDLTSIWVDAAVNGEGVTFLYLA